MLFRSKSSVLVVLAAGLLLPAFAFAASGTISSTAKYAWGNVAGYINFAPTNATVTVTDTTVTGYAWSQNDGWINFKPANGGVINNNGTLSGWAWDESQGWVSFSGVSINTSTGKFTGQATGSNGYVITFSCTYCDVQTTWRPTITNANTNNNPFGGNGPIVGTYGVLNGLSQFLPPTPQTPILPQLEPSYPPPANSQSPSYTGNITSPTPAASPYYQLPTKNVTGSSIGASPHPTATSTNFHKVPPTSTKTWVYMGGGVALLFLLMLLLRFI